MPTKRRTAKSREHRITPEALAAFKAGDSIRLHRALGLRPWQPSPLEADTGPVPWPPRPVSASIRLSRTSRLRP